MGFGSAGWVVGWRAYRSRSNHARALAGLGGDLDAPPDRAETVAHVLKPDAVTGACDVETSAVVADLEMELISLDV